MDIYISDEYMSNQMNEAKKMVIKERLFNREDSITVVI